jgi:ADP-ribose pyrophosphatase YjhB (NUDIX family)
MIFKYCVKCGDLLRLTPIEGRPRLQCPKCGFIFYENSKPTSAGVIIKDGKILLCKRAVNPKKGLWDLPGGFLEAGEHPEQGLHRELKEELGVTAEIEKVLGFYLDQYGEENYHTLNIAFLCHIVSGTPAPHDDVAEVQWFDPSQLPEMAWDSEQKFISNFFHGI